MVLLEKSLMINTKKSWTMPQDRQLLDNLKLVNQTMVQDPDLKESLSL